MPRKGQSAHYLKNEYDQFFIQAGISFELLGKARLATIHPSLIIDKDFDSLLHACDAGKHSKRCPGMLRPLTPPKYCGGVLGCILSYALSKLD